MQQLDQVMNYVPSFSFKREEDAEDARHYCCHQHLEINTSFLEPFPFSVIVLVYFVNKTAIIQIKSSFYSYESYSSIALIQYPPIHTHTNTHRHIHTTTILFMLLIIIIFIFLSIRTEIYYKYIHHYRFDGRQHQFISFFHTFLNIISKAFCTAFESTRFK